MPIPLELITMGTTFLASAFTTLVSASMKSREQMFKHALQRGEMQATIGDRAAKRAEGQPGMQLTRRIIALGVIGSIIFATMVAPIMFPDLPITVGLSETTGGFWFFSDPKETFEWYTFNGGVVVTPFMSHAGTAIIGLFMGNQIAK